VNCSWRAFLPLPSSAKPSPLPCAWSTLREMALRPTEEQLKAVEAYRSGQDLKVVAVAGSGKTTTLRLMAEAAPGRRGLYLAFNRSVREEAARKFPRNVRPYTLHALAFRMTVARDEGYRAKFTAGRGHLPARAVAEALELRNPLLLHAILETLEAFLRSEAASPDPGMIPLAYRILRAGTKTWPEEEAFVLRGVEALWGRMTDPKDPFPLAHGAYVKLWALSEPDLSFVEALLVDEAQDLDPIFLRVLEAHKGRVQRVYVGDPRQQIYGWRGAVNAMERLEAPEARLTWSFRFAEPLARFVRNLTALQDRPVEVLGKAPWATRVDAALPRPPFTVLCRTNAGVVGAVVATQEVHRGRVHVVGGVEELAHLLRDAALLKRGEKRADPHPDLAMVETWEELEALAEAGYAPAYGVLRLAGEHPDLEALAAYLEGVWTPVEVAAKVVVSTAHKAKGKEWDRVVLWDDFFPWWEEETAARVNWGSDPAHLEEENLLYVAATRARKHLSLTRVGSLLEAVERMGVYRVAEEATRAYLLLSAEVLRGVATDPRVPAEHRVRALKALSYLERGEEALGGGSSSRPKF